jgi:hypothetical protein
MGGTESYAFTVAEQFDRLGHEPVIYSPEVGRGAEVARERALTVVGAEDLPGGADVALVQDAATAFEVAQLCPDVPSVFVAHSESFDPQSPPQVPGVVDLLVALNDRVAERLRKFAAQHEVVRLRQPIDTERFTAAGPLPERPARALILSNNNFADRQAMLEEACAAAGMELFRRGGSGHQTTDPRTALAEADVVIGYGRAILEAMSCGRAGFVYDWAGGSGWVTADSYPDIEADGFAGRDAPVYTAADLIAAFAGYDRAMGPVNHDLVIANHRANVHAQELIGLFERLEPREPAPRAALGDMARLVRLEWRARAQVHGLHVENAELHRRVGEIGIKLTEVDKAREVETERREAAKREAEEAKRESAATAHSYESTLSWRLTRPMRSLGAKSRFR